MDESKSLPAEEMSSEEIKERTRILAEDLVFEMNKSMGFKKDSITHSIIRPLVWKPMVRFSELATVFEHRLVRDGWQKASSWFITHFVDKTSVMGEDNIPEEGPLIIAANHPGAYDSLVISSFIPRDDLKIISSDIPFVKKLPETSKHMIFLTHEPHDRMNAARKAIRHLKKGGALLVFARATMDPDPAFSPGAEIELTRWTSSLGLFLRNVPQTRLAVSLISGVLSPKYLSHPIRLFRRGFVNKQRLSEFLQVMSQLLAPGKMMVSPNLTFDKYMRLADLELKDPKDINQITAEVIKRAQSHFDFHQERFLKAGMAG